MGTSCLPARALRVDLLLHGSFEGVILGGGSVDGSTIGVHLGNLSQAALCGAQDKAACLRDINLHLRGQQQVCLWEELNKTNASIT